MAWAGCRAVNHPRAEQPPCPPLPRAADWLYGISSAPVTLLSCQPLNQLQAGVTPYGNSLTPSLGWKEIPDAAALMH